MIPGFPWGGAGWRALGWSLRAEAERARDEAALAVRSIGRLAWRMTGGSMLSQFHQWSTTVAALAVSGADDAGPRARQVHRHRDALQRIYSRTADLVQLTRTELEARALAAGIGLGYVDLDRETLHAFVARVEVERELRELDATVRALTSALDWPSLEEALRRGWAPVLRYEGHAEHDAAVRKLRSHILQAGYRVLPEDPGARLEEVPC